MVYREYRACLQRKVTRLICNVAVLLGQATAVTIFDLMVRRIRDGLRPVTRFCYYVTPRATFESTSSRRYVSNRHAPIQYAAIQYVAIKRAAIENGFADASSRDRRLIPGRCEPRI